MLGSMKGTYLHSIIIIIINVVVYSIVISIIRYSMAISIIMFTHRSPGSRTCGWDLGRDGKALPPLAVIRHTKPLNATQKNLTVFVLCCAGDLRTQNSSQVGKEGMSPEHRCPPGQRAVV